MTALRTAAQQALDTLLKSHTCPLMPDDCEAAIAALRAALAVPSDCPNSHQPVQEPAQEPVAWRWGYRSVTTGEMDWRGYVEIAADPNLRSPEIIMQPLYIAPPQRKPLTDEEIDELLRTMGLGKWSVNWLCRAVEKAHGIT